MPLFIVLLTSFFLVQRIPGPGGNTTGSSSVNFGLAFSATAFGTLPSSTVWANNYAYPHTYTNGLSQSVSCGITGGNVWDGLRDRDNTLGVLSGIGFMNANTVGLVIQCDLPSTGSYTISIGAGDANNAQNQWITLRENGTPFQTCGSSATPIATATGQYMDATCVVRTSASNWQSSAATVSHTFTSTVFEVVTKLATSPASTLNYIGFTKP